MLVKSIGQVERGLAARFVVNLMVDEAIEAMEWYERALGGRRQSSR